MLEEGKEGEKNWRKYIKEVWLERKNDGRNKRTKE